MLKENLLDTSYLINKCDYSFGVLSGWYPPKKANSTNKEFLYKCMHNTVPKGLLHKKYLILYIDNIRLYRRVPKYNHMEMPELFGWNSDYIHNRHMKDRLLNKVSDEDLLQLLSYLPNKFVIFTGMEDTPIDDFIFDRIPDNVLGIYAANSISFGGKVHPIPFGLSLSLNKELFLKAMYEKIEPNNLLYVNHSLGSNPIRTSLNEFFAQKDWAFVDDRVECSHHESHYFRYFGLIKQHKFMLCPDGNAIGCECYRDWEVLYMRRVPIVERTAYMLNMFQGLPVLYVDSFFDVTEELLLENEHLYQEALTFDMNKLDMVLRYNKIIEEIESKL